LKRIKPGCENIFLIFIEILYISDGNDEGIKKVTQRCVTFWMNYFLTGFAAGFETGFATGFATGFEVGMVERLLSTSFIPLFGSFVVN
jgi:hypothetical protein